MTALQNPVNMLQKELLKKQSVIDIQRQFKVLPVAEQENLQAANYVFAEMLQAINALFTFAILSAAEECQWWAAATNALILLCTEQESQGFRSHKADVKVKEEKTSVFPPPSLSETPSVEYIATQCIFCLGNQDQPSVDRLKTFASRGDLKKLSIAIIFAAIPTVSRSRAPNP
ncbi:hypothetical protein MMC21_007179 [Puttea exsequens]|nr:hypothetical protein [Puttea exsequens]